MKYKFLNVLLLLFILFISLSVVSAQDNTTTHIAQDELTSSENVQKEISTDVVGAKEVCQKVDTQIKVKTKDSYYKEKNNLVSYLKDTNGTPIKNKQMKIFLNGKEYKKTTDKSGKITLPLNLKPKNYKLTVRFYGDEKYAASTANSIIKIKKIPAAIKMSNYNTFEGSNFFKVKVYNKDTKSPISSIKVLFKIYNAKTKKTTSYYAKTNKKGIAVLKKNLKTGTYKVTTQIKDSKNKKFIKFKKSNKRITLKIKPAPDGEDCCSFYLQVSKTESYCGFRRDGKRNVNILIKPSKWQGRTAMRHYKTSPTYFVHLIVTSDGWMVGNGGLDKKNTVKAIENLAGDMIRSNKIKKDSLKKIQKFKQSVHFGHFSIKSPDGRYAVVWEDNLITGKLKPGEFSCSPNNQYLYRHSTYSKFDSNPAKAAVKVGATDKYGQRRRNVVVFHWQATTSKNFKTTSQLWVRASNECGKMIGKSFARYTDNIRYKDRIINHKELPKTPGSMLLGIHKFGNIDKFIKTPTSIHAPSVSNKVNKTKYFNFVVKNKKTNKRLSNIKIKLVISNKKMSKSYVVKTNANGLARFNTKNLLVGKYNAFIRPANNQYLISAKSKISIIG